jgi:hypothetical protein
MVTQPFRVPSRLLRLLADDLLRSLVVAEADVAGVSQLAVGCPLAEADLCDQLGVAPSARPSSTGPSRQ